ncbi:MAG: 2,3-bisphosphoglycerate-independent phosphoglycerate mutase, partial [Tateyamaria sp.]|nr:2,3-bisphosphoglycerate-independent phosphoglycerate mutase [Tateyamaria sp.]
GQMGNSEVGHTNIGAGRVVAMDLGQIDLAIEDGSFFLNKSLVDWIANIKEAGGRAHLMGVISDGGVHGHLNHMIAAVKACTDAGLQVLIHAIADGRDVAPKSAITYLKALNKAIPMNATVCSLTGRYYALDRDNRWERVETAYEAIVQSDGVHAETAQAAIEAAYNEGKTDEFIPASVIDGYNGAIDGDGFFCLNFRADRAREIMAAIGDPDFKAFDNTARPMWSGILGMVDYSEAHEAFMSTVYPKPEIINTLGQWVALAGLRQFRLAETEKYPHVTFFLNGGKEKLEIGEDRAMPNSPAVATYDLMPSMSSSEVTDEFIAAIEDGYDLIVVNYANPDMVGHTGNLAAAIAACEAVDAGLARVIPALEAVGGVMIITADHGNCEMMIDPMTGEPHTAHTTNLVPAILIGTKKSLVSGRLADLSPTLLELMQLEKPKEMTGKSLLR